MFGHVAVVGHRLVRALTAATLLCSVAACSVTLISHYDEQIDKAATDLQKRMDAHLTRLESATGADAQYAASQHFYIEYLVDLRSVELRASVHPKNQVSLAQYELMRSSLENLRTTHEEEDTLSPDYIGPVRELFATSWKAIIQLEVAKKRDAG